MCLLQFGMSLFFCLNIYFPFYITSFFLTLVSFQLKTVLEQLKLLQRSYIFLYYHFPITEQLSQGNITRQLQYVNLALGRKIHIQQRKVFFRKNHSFQKSENFENFRFFLKTSRRFFHRDSFFAELVSKIKKLVRTVQVLYVFVTLSSQTLKLTTFVYPHCNIIKNAC